MLGDSSTFGPDSDILSMLGPKTSASSLRKATVWVLVLAQLTRSFSELTALTREAIVSAFSRSEPNVLRDNRFDDRVGVAPAMSKFLHKQFVLGASALELAQRSTIEVSDQDDERT